MAKQPQGTPLEAFQRIKRMMRQHWLESLTEDLATVEAALSGTQEEPRVASAPDMGEGEPEEETPPARPQPRKPQR